MINPRVLLSAYQCAPGLGSVSQIGWEWYSRLSRRTSVTLITHARNRPALEAAGAPLPGSDVLFIDTEWFAGPLYRTSKKLFPRSEHAVFLLSSLDFYLYDYQALRLIRKRALQQWDVIHAVTPVSPLAATRLCRIRLPSIVGPWNGGLSSPQAFAEIMRQDSAWVYRIRSAGRLADKAVRCTKNAAVILSAGRATDESLPSESRTRVKRMLENGVDLSIFRPGALIPPPSSQNPLRVLFVGRLIPVKGLSLLLEAVARVKAALNLRLTIAGDGPVRGDLEREIAARQLTDVVTLTGNLPLAQVSQHMRESHVFCLPSVRESGGAVLLEAMGCAIPVLAVNYGGPAEIVDDEVGRLLSADDPEALVADLVAALRDCVRHPERWRQRGAAGRRRTEARYGWDAKMDDAMKLYRELAFAHTARLSSKKAANA